MSKIVIRKPVKTLIQIMLINVNSENQIKLTEETVVMEIIDIKSKMGIK